MPPDDPSDHALSIARLAGDGVGAAVLVGSQARGDAGPESDLDVLAVGPRTFTSRPERRDGLLLSVSSQPFEAYRREMADPGSVCTAVPDWREAVVLHNPEGKAGALLEEARAWTWGPGVALRRVGGGGDHSPRRRGAQAGRGAPGTACGTSSLKGWGRSGTWRSPPPSA